MKIRKDVMFAILTTFCMCALMFTVIPIRSGLPYDPWADIDDNGKIDMKDIGNVAAQFMTSGDPTKNVTVTNWPSQQNANVTNWPQDRPPTVKKGVEELSIIDSFSGGDGNGEGAALGIIAPTHRLKFVYNFESKGTFINVSSVSINYIWRADNGNGHSIRWLFEGYPYGSPYATVTTSGPPYTNMPNAANIIIDAYYEPSFDLTVIRSGLNMLELLRDDGNGAYIYFFSLVMFIEYYYWE
jgi:hypothetical protein